MNYNRLFFIFFLFCSLVLLFSISNAQATYEYKCRVGQTLDLGEGYSLYPKQIDVENSKVWFELSKDGVYIDDKVMVVGYNYAIYDTVSENRATIKFEVLDAYQGQVDTIVVIGNLKLDTGGVIYEGPFGE